MDYIPVEQYIHTPSHTATVVVLQREKLTCARLRDIANVLNNAQAHITNKKYKDAIALLDNAILEIGMQYSSSASEDDTSLKLILANRINNVEQAAHLKHAVLESRMAMFTAQHQCNTRPDEVKPTDYIGEVRMEDNGEIILLLFARDNNGTSGQATVRYPKDHPQYYEIVKHVGGLKPGERKGVPPWP